MEHLIISRAIERILIILAAALSIYLGYRLLLAMPETVSGEGKVSLPMGTSIVVSRLGPGAFFALFGCVVLTLALRHALQIHIPPVSPSSKEAVQESARSSVTTSFTYLQSQSGSLAKEFNWLPEKVLRDLFYLNQLSGALRQDLEASFKDELEQLVLRGKLLVLHPHWQPTWGAEVAFREWVLSGFAGNRPADTDDPWRLFNYGRRME